MEARWYLQLSPTLPVSGAVRDWRNVSVSGAFINFRSAGLWRRQQTYIRALNSCNSVLAALGYSSRAFVRAFALGPNGCPRMSRQKTYMRVK